MLSEAILSQKCYLPASKRMSRVIIPLDYVCYIHLLNLKQINSQLEVMFMWIYSLNQEHQKYFSIQTPIWLLAHISEVLTE